MDHLVLDMVPSSRPAAGVAASFTLPPWPRNVRSRSELAELVPDHVFGDEHLHVLLAVVDHEREADEFRHHRAGPGPRLDRIALAARELDLHLLEQAGIDERTFFRTASHGAFSRHG